MLPVVWDETAREDLTEIVGHIADFNPVATYELPAPIGMRGAFARRTPVHVSGKL